MTRVTDFHLVNENGDGVPRDAFGNNVAFKCPKCGHPTTISAIHFLSFAYSSSVRLRNIPPRPISSP